MRKLFRYRHHRPTGILEFDEVESKVIHWSRYRVKRSRLMPKPSGSNGAGTRSGLHGRASLASHREANEPRFNRQSSVSSRKIATAGDFIDAEAGGGEAKKGNGPSETVARWAKRERNRRMREPGQQYRDELLFAEHNTLKYGT